MVFTYRVSRSINTKIDGKAIVVVDDNGTPNDPSDDFQATPVLTSRGYNIGDTNGNGSMDGNETWIYSSPVFTAQDGLHGNVGRVTVKIGNTTYGARDMAWYSGATLGVAIKKATNAVDPWNPTAAEEGDDVAHQLNLAVGTPVTWTYRVTNSGTAPLTVVSIVDDRGTPSTTDDFRPVPVLLNGFNVGDVDRDGLLDVGEVWLFTSSGLVSYAARPGQFVSAAVVTARTPGLATAVTASDPSLHFGSTTALRVIKAVNAVDPWNPTATEDANTAPGRTFFVGDEVVWTYLVTNTGTTVLDVHGVLDDDGTGDPNQGFAADPVLGDDGFVRGDTNRNGMLDPGETWLYSATGIVSLGAYRNTATVTAKAIDQAGARPVTATDVANLTGIEPGIRVKEYLDGVRATDPTQPIITAVGVTVTYTYEVDAPTRSALTNVTIVDDNGTPTVPGDDFVPTFVGGDSNGDGRLDPGEVWLFSATRVVTAGPYANIVTVSGRLTSESGTSVVTATDVNHSMGLVSPPEVTLVKAVNALDPFRPTPVEDANTRPGKELLVGSTATWTYVVRNTGVVPVTLTTLVDDMGTPTNPSDDVTPVASLVPGTTFNVGDVNRNRVIDPGEAWLFSATSVVRSGAYMNTATVVVTKVGESTTARAKDVANIYGNAGGEGLTPGYWKNHPESWPTWSDGSLVWSTNQTVGSVFTGLPPDVASMTLIQALDYGGGGIAALLRHSVSALLSTSSARISYPASARWIIDQTNAAIASGNDTRIENLKNVFAAWNEREANLAPPR